MKKIIFLLVVFFSGVMSVFASGISGVMLNDKVYSSLADAVIAASDGDVITLFSSFELDEEILIDKDITINLNGNNVSSESVVFLVEGGKLTISGNGVIKERKPNYGPIKVIGSSSSSDAEYSVVNVEDGVVLEGWSGIFITHNQYKSYGVVVNFDGDINAVSDVNGGEGAGIYANGNIQDKTASPIINVLENATIKSNGVGLYIAGYSNVNINGGYIEGSEAGIGIKAGKLIINGAEVICNGADETPTEGNNNGILASGTTIQIESNDGYAGDIELDISSGKFISENSHVIYEYIGRGSDSLVKSMSISGGEFVSNSKDVFLVSDSFTDKHSDFITGGFFSSDPKSFVKLGYIVSLEDGSYYVSDSLKNVFKEDSNGSNFFKVICVIGCFILGIFVYFKRNKFCKFRFNVC